MGAIREQLESGAANFVWLDHTDYAATLLNKGAVPWLDVGEFVSLQRRAQGLLKPHVVALALAPACEAWLAAHAPLREAIGAKSRALFPLKTLLADETLRAHLVELATGLRASLADVPLALVLPSPRAWIGVAYAQAFPGDEVEVDNDEADSASVYIADFLRSFGSCGVDALLLEEERGYVPSSADDIACYQSVLNVAANYRWDVGLRVRDELAGDTVAALDFVIATKSVAALGGIELGDEFWSGAAAAPADVRLRYAVIPANAQPELVLERLESLR
jgi:hypothetical protein